MAKLLKNVIGLCALAWGLTIKSPEKYHELMDAIVRGWDIGKRSELMMAVRWEELWERPLSEVKRQLGVEKEPACVA